MNKSKGKNRRRFIKLSAVALGGLPLASQAAYTWPPFEVTSSQGLNVSVFSKHLQFLNYSDMANAAKEIGFDGIDLTVRPKGHVLPENVETDLPRVTEAMKMASISPNLLTTSVQNAENQIDRKVLETAADLGYTLYRMGWYKYAEDQPIPKSLQAYKRQLLDLAQLNAQAGISGGYQNHSGNYMGSSIWDLAEAIDGIPKNQLGCQYDITHATIEGGKNWPQGLRLIKDHINSLAIKDFKWVKTNGRWKVQYVPLGEGMVDFNQYFTLLKKYQINVPVSLHFEYELGGAEKGAKNISMSQKEVFAKMKHDLQFIKKGWENA